MVASRGRQEEEMVQLLKQVDVAVEIGLYLLFSVERIVQSWNKRLIVECWLFYVSLWWMFAFGLKDLVSLFESEKKNKTLIYMSIPRSAIYCKICKLKYYIYCKCNNQNILFLIIYNCYSPYRLRLSCSCLSVTGNLVKSKNDIWNIWMV